VEKVFEWGTLKGLCINTCLLSGKYRVYPMYFQDAFIYIISVLKGVEKYGNSDS